MHCLRSCKLVLLIPALLSLAAEYAIRDETAEEHERLVMSSDISSVECARDYSDYLGKSLSDLGASGGLVVRHTANNEPGKDESPRPTDSVIRTAIADYVLALFRKDERWDYHRRSRPVTGEFVDGKRFTIFFAEGLPVKAMIEIEPKRLGEFRLVKKTGQR
jgi:hypothetical protein